MADLADIARGLQSGLSSFLTQQAREREQERREAAEERREARERRRREEHRSRMRSDRNRRTIQEAEAASRGIELEGVERTESGGPQAYGPRGRELNVTDVRRRGLEAEGESARRYRESPVPILTGDESLMGPDQQLEGMATGRPELEPLAEQGGGGGVRQALSEEMSRAARAGPGAEPDVEAGAIDPATGTFASSPVFRGGGGRRGADIGEVLREGEVRQESPTYQLSSGQEFQPGAREERILREEVNRIMEARPDLSRAEAELLAEGPAEALSYRQPEPEEGLDRTYNVRGREFRDQDEAVDAYRAFQDEGGYGGGGGGGSLTQTEELAVQYGFTQPDGSPDLAGFERFQQRVDNLRQVYGNAQGAPVLQKAIEARAMGLSEREVLNRLTSQARQQEFSQAEIEQLREDVRGFFSQRSRRQIQRLQEGDLSGPNFGSGFDLRFAAPSDSTAGGGGGGGGIGAMRGSGGGR